MAYETVKRNNSNDHDIVQLANHISRYHSDDMQDFHLPLERMHNSYLHNWGIASGLEVSGTIGGTEIVVNSGVAIDKNGQLISLPSIGHADIGENPSEGDSNEVIVPVHLSTINYAGKTVYVTIHFSEISRPNDGVLGRMEQVPWVRLRPIDSFQDNEDGESIILAVGVLDAAGRLSEMKTADGKHRRHLIGETVEELRIQKSIKIGDQVQDMPSGKIGPGNGGGLKITVPGDQDSILFAREDGNNFSNFQNL
jgi:hypothetical protein